ncbi:hypothetical protein LINPERPRIM_LOCUS24863 [Linum perenne]
MIWKPVKKFVREELNVKVCVLRDKVAPCPTAITLHSKMGNYVC